MLRINVYIPEELNQQLQFAADYAKTDKAKIIREALQHGLSVIQSKSNTAEALLSLAKKAKKIPTKGKLPKDLIKNLDFYTWGGEKRE